jgi:hypothetical protein
MTTILSVRKNGRVVRTTSVGAFVRYVAVIGVRAVCDGADVRVWGRSSLATARSR